MSSSTRRAFFALALFLVLSPLAVGRPGMPPTLKADEPAYFLMAESLAHDRDLRCERADIDRLLAAFPFAPVHNLILMSDDQWQTIYFGKPYLYSLLAAPLVALFGFSGMLATNLLLVALMIWWGTRYLSAFNSGATALLFSATFFLLGPSMIYAFWAHPEVFNMAAVAGCLYYGLRPRGDDESSPRGRFSTGHLAPWLSGAALALGAYNKPMLAALALPVAVALWRRRGWRAVAAWGSAGLLTGIALAGLSWGLTGTASAYLGVDRAGIHLSQPDDLATQVQHAAVSTGRRENANSWQWIVQRPDFDPPEFLENFGYFLVGRHTGWVPYMPLAVLATLLFLIHGARSPSRWLLVLALAAIALFFLVAIPINWHGGGGFVGNRYFAMVYPAFLFLVTAVRPAWAPLAGTAVAALLLGPLVMTPYGAPVPHPTLQAHVRSPLFQLFPLELTLRERIPGYVQAGYGKILFIGRRDVVRVTGTRMKLQAGTPVELWVMGPEPIGSFLFEVRSPVPNNRIRLKMGKARADLRFAPGRRGERGPRTVELTPGKPRGTSWFKPVRFKQGNPAYVYRLEVEASHGEVAESERRSGPWMLVGAEINYLGTREQVSRPEHYRIAWDEVASPAAVSPGEVFTVRARVRNQGESDWDPEAALPVRLGYHWLSSSGQTIQLEGRRSDLPGVVPQGEDLETMLEVKAPDEPGSYLLVLDAIREPIAWFSARGGATFDVAVEVSAPRAPAAESAPPPGDSNTT